MLQETLNGFWEAGSDQVRRSDVGHWVDPSSDATLAALREWQSRGFVAIVADPRESRDKTVCLRILRRINALPMPEDLNEEATPQT
jgi:hypothetical protein